MNWWLVLVLTSVAALFVGLVIRRSRREMPVEDARNIYPLW